MGLLLRLRLTFAEWRFSVYEKRIAEVRVAVDEASSRGECAGIDFWREEYDKCEKALDRWQRQIHAIEAKLGTSLFQEEG
jgi:hypothetical protein